MGQKISTELPQIVSKLTESSEPGSVFANLSKRVTKGTNTIFDTAAAKRLIDGDNAIKAMTNNKIIQGKIVKGIAKGKVVSWLIQHFDLKLVEDLTLYSVILLSVLVFIIMASIGARVYNTVCERAKIDDDNENTLQEAMWLGGRAGLNAENLTSGLVGFLVGGGYLATYDFTINVLVSAGMDVAKKIGKKQVENQTADTLIHGLTDSMPQLKKFAVQSGYSIGLALTVAVPTFLYVFADHSIQQTLKEIAVAESKSGLLGRECFATDVEMHNGRENEDAQAIFDKKKHMSQMRKIKAGVMGFATGCLAVAGFFFTIRLVRYIASFGLQDKFLFVIPPGVYVLMALAVVGFGLGLSAYYIQLNQQCVGYGGYLKNTINDWEKINEKTGFYVNNNLDNKGQRYGNNTKSVDGGDQVINWAEDQQDKVKEKVVKCAEQDKKAGEAAESNKTALIVCIVVFTILAVGLLALFIIGTMPQFTFFLWRPTPIAMLTSALSAIKTGTAITASAD